MTAMSETPASVSRAQAVAVSDLLVKLQHTINAYQKKTKVCMTHNFSVNMNQLVLNLDVLPITTLLHCTAAGGRGARRRRRQRRAEYRNNALNSEQNERVIDLKSQDSSMGVLPGVQQQEPVTPTYSGPLIQSIPMMPHQPVGFNVQQQDLRQHTENSPRRQTQRHPDTIASVRDIAHQERSLQIEENEIREENSNLSLLLHDSIKRYDNVDAAKTLVETKLKMFIRRRYPQASRDSLLAIFKVRNEDILIQEKAQADAEAKKNHGFHKPNCSNHSTCFCRFIPLHLREEAWKKLEEPVNVNLVRWVRCKNEITINDCFWVPEVELHKHKMFVFLRTAGGLKIELEAHQQRMCKYHPSITRLPIQEEYPFLFTTRQVDVETLFLQIKKAAEGDMLMLKQNMKWVQMDKAIIFIGAGWILPEDPESLPRFCVLQIPMGTFTDDTQLHEWCIFQPTLYYSAYNNLRLANEDGLRFTLQKRKANNNVLGLDNEMARDEWVSVTLANKNAKRGQEAIVPAMDKWMEYEEKNITS